MQSALLLVDVQQDFLARPGLEPAADAVCKQLADLLHAVRQLHWPVIHVVTETMADGSNAMPHWRTQQKKECVSGSAGAAPPLALQALPGELQLNKTFFSAFGNPDLVLQLYGLGVQRLIIAGLYTHACIRNTALDAYQAGFEVILARQAMASTEPLHAATTLNYLSLRGIQVLDTSAILLLNTGAGIPPNFVHFDPCNTDNILFEQSYAAPGAIAEALDRLRPAQPGWGCLPHRDRQAALSRWQSSLEAVREKLIFLIIQDLAKPLRDARAEFDYAMALLAHSAELTAEEQGKPTVRYQPHGVVGLITPWNNPLAIAVGKLAPALVFGNVVIWKPALPAARVSALIAEALHQAGLQHLFALIQGGHETGRQLACTPGIACVSFTGSTKAGRQLQYLCAGRGIPLQAEMGGNNAVLVMADTDLVRAAREIAQAMFSFAGQRCTATRRIIVEASVRELFSACLKHEIECLPAGGITDEQTRLAPVISRGKMLDLLSDIKQAREQGAGVLCGGRVREGAGNWLMPTVLTDVALDAPLFCNESFGPIALLVCVENGDEAIRVCNAVGQGLLACLFSEDTAMQQRFVEQVQAGMLVINQARPAFAANAPFSAWKDSGAGLPEHGRWARDFFSRPQAVYS